MKTIDYQKFVDEAALIKEFMDKPPLAFQILMDKWKEIQSQALDDLKNPALPDDTLKHRQLLSNEIDRWVAMPEYLISLGLIAKEEEMNIANQNTRPQKELY